MMKLEIKQIHNRNKIDIKNSDNNHNKGRTKTYIYTMLIMITPMMILAISTTMLSIVIVHS